MKYLCVGILFCATAGFATADCFRQRVVVAPAFVPAVSVVTPVAVAVPVLVPTFSVQYVPQPVVQQPAPAAKPPEPALPPKLDDVETRALSILRTNCASCHTGTNPKGKVSFFDATGSPLAGLPRAKIFYQSHKGTMPKDGKALSDDDVNVLLEWMNK